MPDETYRELCLIAIILFLQQGIERQRHAESESANACSATNYLYRNLKGGIRKITTPVNLASA